MTGGKFIANAIYFPYRLLCRGIEIYSKAALPPTRTPWVAIRP